MTATPSEPNDDNTPDSDGSFPSFPESPSFPSFPESPTFPTFPSFPKSPSAPKAVAMPGAGPGGSPVPGASAANSSNIFTVNARGGLRMRSGPGRDFPIIKLLALGSALVVLKHEGEWAQVDLEGDGVADGFVHGSFLKPASDDSATQPQAGTSPLIPAGNDILQLVTPEIVKSIFPAATQLAKIKTNLPFVLSGLKGLALVDKPMVLMALGTIRAETEGFVPISEGVSHFNTLNTPFDLYDAGTSIGRNLGNSERGDGPFFKGRGYVQLTGRANYTAIGRQIGQPLATQPDLANDPTIAGVILAQFLKNKEGAIRAALQASDLAKARRLVNGGTHGLDRFTDTFNRGMAALPG